MSTQLVRDAMHVGVISCPVETSVADAMALINRYRIHAVVITEGPGHLAGVLSQTDLPFLSMASDELSVDGMGFFVLPFWIGKVHLLYFFQTSERKEILARKAGLFFFTCLWFVCMFSSTRTDLCT